jgi:pilus assembly protein Flp/PilA
MKKLAIKLIRDEEGATAIEYGVIAGVVVIALIGILNLFRTALHDLFNRAQDQIQQGINTGKGT